MQSFRLICKCIHPYELVLFFVFSASHFLPFVGFIYPFFSPSIPSLFLTIQYAAVPTKDLYEWRKYIRVCVCVSRWFRTVNLWVDLLYRLKIQVIWKDSIPNHHTIFQHSLSISHVVSLTHTLIHAYSKTFVYEHQIRFYINTC